MIPTPGAIAARSPLRWVPSPVATLDDDAARALLVESACALAGLGAAETWAGRNEAYRDALAGAAGSEAAEGDAFRRAYCPTQTTPAQLASWSLSSCALTVRSLWRELGVRLGGVPAPYRDGQAMANVVGVARSAGLLSSSDFGQVGPGWTIWKAGLVHVATVVHRDGADLWTVDGGQAGGIGAGSEIALVHRRLAPGLAVVLVSDSGRAMPVGAWCDAARIPRSAPPRVATRAWDVPTDAAPASAPATEPSA